MIEFDDDDLMYSFLNPPLPSVESSSDQADLESLPLKHDKPIQVYNRQTTQLYPDSVPMPASFATPASIAQFGEKNGENITSSDNVPTLSTDDEVHSHLDQPIALRKGKQSCTTSHPLHNFFFCSLISFISCFCHIH